LKTITWRNDFIGIGYRYHDVYMNVFPLFQEKKYASKLWDKSIYWWPDDQIKLRFVEKGNNYWFILYNNSQNVDENTGFAKDFQLSANYQRFKEGYEKQAILRFGIYRENIKNKKDQGKFNLELLKKHKMVYDIKFLDLSSLSDDSVEMSFISSFNGNNKGGRNA
jgi:hypothetical protein